MEVSIEILELDASIRQYSDLANRIQASSCSPKGKLSLNPMLVKAPSVCIDYVFVHERCHLEHRKHDNAFYKFLKRQLPECDAY